MFLFSLLMGLGQQAKAQEAAPIEIVFLCQAKKNQKTIALFKQGNTFIYQYGSDMGRPELQLVRSSSAVTKQPWNGVGSEMWQNITLNNKAYSYTVYSSYGRKVNGKISAGVSISKGSKHLTSVECHTGDNFMDNLEGFVE